MHSTIKYESFFRILFIIRKSLPQKQILYSFLILIKFISPYLLTHNLKYFDTTSILFTRIFSKLLLIQESSTYNLSPNYGVICLIIFLILLLFIIIASLIAWMYVWVRKNKEDISIKGIRSTSLFFRFRFKNTLKWVSYVFLIIIFFSQHIVEYVFFVIFAQIAVYVNSNILPDYQTELELFQRNSSINLSVIVVLNSFTIILLFLMTYCFFMFASTKTINVRYGNRTIVPNKSLILFVFLFQFQGVYSMLPYFTVDYRNLLRLILCIVITILLGLYILFSIKHYHYAICQSLLFLDFMCFLCFISGICEIIIYYTVDSPIPFKLSLLVKCIEFFNAIFIIILIRRRIEDNALAALSQRIFSEDNTSTNITNVIILLQLLSQYLEGKKVYDALYQCVYHHVDNCHLEGCMCHSFMERLNEKTYENEKKEIIHLLSLVAERDIVKGIKIKDTNDISTNELLLFHVDYIMSVTNNRYLTLYLCQYYLINKSNRLHLTYAYAIYEMYLLIRKSMKEKKITKRRQNITNREIGYIKENKMTHKHNELIQKITILENIKKTLINCCKDFSRIMSYRQIMKTNKQCQVTCQSTINAIIQLNKRNQQLRSILNYYLSEQPIVPGEECYLLHCYFNLIQGKLPSEYKDRIQDMESFTQIYINDTSYSVMILSLSALNKFIIKYATLSFIEQLGYTQSELINSDVHENLLFGPFKSFHFAQMKLFLLNGPRTLDKDTFTFSKVKSAVRVNISVRPLPTKDCLSLIVKLRPISTRFNGNLSYYALTDQYLTVISTCHSFERRFKINLIILKESNLSLGQFFGVNPDSIKITHDTLQSKNNYFSEFKQYQSILTTVKEEEIPFYYDDYYLIQRKKVIINKTITRAKFIQSIEFMKKHIIQSGIDKDWIKNIEELHNEIRSKKNCQFELTIEYKKIGESCYCIVTIREKVPDYSLFDFDNEDIVTLLHKRYNLNSNIVSHTRSPFLINQEQSNINNNTNLSVLIDDKGFNESNLQLFSSLNNFASQNKRASLVYSSKPNAIQLNRTNSMNLLIIFILKIIGWCLLICLITLDLIYLFRSSNSYAKIETYFYISITSYILSSDLYYSAISCVKLCVVSNDIVIDDYAYIQQLIKERVKNLMLNNYKLCHYINRMNQTNEIKDVYEIVTSYDSYDYMELNGMIRLRNSTFIEEIYNLYFLVSQFDPSIPSKCRLKDIFYNDNYKTFTPESGIVTSQEERTLFYLLNNVIPKLGIKIFDIYKSINKIIAEFSKNNTGFVMVWVLTLCGIGTIFYNSIIVTLFLLRSVLKSQMEIIFDNIQGEDTFSQKLQKYTALLNNVFYKEFYQYQNKPHLNVDHSVSIISKSLISNNKKKLNNDKDNQGRRSVIKKSNKNNSSNNNNNRSKSDTLSDNETQSNNKTFKKFMRLPLLIIGMFFAWSGIISYIILQIVVIIFTINVQNITNAQNDMSSNFQARIPQLEELFLYATRSVLANDQYQQRTNMSDFNYYVMNNYFRITPNIEHNSFFSSLGESYFALLYYLHIISSENIQLFQSDEKKSSILPNTAGLENKINQKDEFCLATPLVFTQSLKIFPSLKESFTKINTLTTECRSIFNGVNLNGFQSAVDLLFNQFIIFYIDFFKKNLDKRDIDDFFTAQETIAFEDDLQLTFKLLIDSEKYLIVEDIIPSINEGGLVDIIFTLVSLSINGVFGFVTLLVFVSKFEQYNNVVNQFVIFFHNSIRSNNYSDVYN